MDDIDLIAENAIAYNCDLAYETNRIICHRSVIVRAFSFLSKLKRFYYKVTGRSLQNGANSHKTTGSVKEKIFTGIVKPLHLVVFSNTVLWIRNDHTFFFRWFRIPHEFFLIFLTRILPFCPRLRVLEVCLVAYGTTKYNLLRGFFVRNCLSE